MLYIPVIMDAIINYFRCDPFEINFRLLVFSGYWPIYSKNKLVLVVYSIYSYLCWFSIISMLFIQVLDLYLLRNDPLHLVQSLSASVMTCTSIFKYLLVFYTIEKVIDLHDRLNKFRQSRTDPADIEIIENGNQQILTSTKAFYGLAIPCIIIWMLYPGLDSSDKKRVPFPYRFPLDMTQTPIYEIIYLYQSMSMVGFMIIIVSTDLIFYGFAIRINNEYDFLIRRVKQMDSLWEDQNCWKKTLKITDACTTERILKFIKGISQTHQTILSEIDDIKHIYAGPYMVHAFLASALVGINVIDIVSISKGLSLQLLQRMMFTICTLFDSFLVSLFATQMQNQAIKFFRSIYTTPWYRVSPKVRRDLFIICMRTSVAPTIKLAKIFPLNLSSFLQFLKTSYNMTTLMYQTIKK